MGSRTLAIVTHRKGILPTRVSFEAPCRLRHKPGPTLKDTQILRPLLKPRHSRSKPSIASQAWEPLVQLCREKSTASPSTGSAHSSKFPVCVCVSQCVLIPALEILHAGGFCSTLQCSRAHLPASICHLLWERQPCVSCGTLSHLWWLAVHRKGVYIAPGYRVTLWLSGAHCRFAPLRVGR